MSFPTSASPLSDVRRALAVFAHPDDVDFGGAGAVASWTAAGVEVAYLLITGGESGAPLDLPREEVRALREAELRAAAAAVGVTQVEYLDGYADGMVTPTLALRRDITAAIRRFRPDRVLTSSPLRRWENLVGPSHPDHLAVGEATTCAVYPDSRNPFAFPELLAEGLEPWVVREVWYAGGPNPDYAVDITDLFPQRVAALQAHASQTAHLDVADWLRARFTAEAQAAGLPAGRLAETFTMLRTD